MKQLVLNIQPPAQPALADIVCGRNSELVALLQSLCDGKYSDPVYLWGPPACGKSLAVRALSSCLGTCIVEGERPRWPEHEGPLLVDDVDRLPSSAQIDAFDRFNHNRGRALPWVATGSQAPAGLTWLRDDLRTRLGWGLIYQIHPLDDIDKRQALFRRADRLGFELEPQIADYLMSRYSRDLGQLLSVVEALDRFSLEQQRRVTLPLLKELLPTA